MGDLQSEEERDIVLELVLPALPGPIEEDPVIRAQLSYFNVITSQMDSVDTRLVVSRTGELAWELVTHTCTCHGRVYL